MAKDYAKMYAGRKGKPSGNRPHSFLIGIVCLVLGAVAAVVFHNGLPHFASGKTVALRARLGLPPGSAQAQTAEVKPAPPAPTDAPVKFDFYSELPSTTVSVSTGAGVQKSGSADAEGSTKRPQDQAALTPVKAEATSTPPGSVSSHFVLQLGVFSDKRAAAQTRLNFLLSGIDSIIVQEKSASGGIIFRIQQGPYATERAARTAEARLRRKGIEGLVRKVVDMDATIPT